jgi:hypothetical protein
MQLVSEQQVADPPHNPQLFSIPQPTTTRIPTSDHAWKAAAWGTINVLAAVLSAKMIVLAAVLGGIGLTCQALVTPDPLRVVALGVYGCLVVIPSVWLAISGR